MRAASPPTGAAPQYPAVYADKIAWQDSRGGDWDIYAYDWATGKTKQITTGGSGQTRPAIYADKIVWQDFRHGNWDIYLYNLTTGAETRITTDGSTQTVPAIYGDKIVWEDYRNGADNPDIYLRDLAGGGERRITDDPKKQRLPAIQGNRIVWEDNRVRYFDVWLYDLTTGREYRMSTHRSSERYPHIYGDNIVWHAKRQKNNDVFLFEIVPPRTSWTTNLGAPNGLNNWYTTRPLVTLTADEAAAIFYQWDSASVSGWQTYNGPFSAPEGRHTLYFYGDCAGKIEAVKSKKIKIDTTAPLASVGSPEVALKPNRAGDFKVFWSHVDPAPLSRFTAYDVEYKVGGGRWAPWRTNTKAVLADFAGSLGKTYYFRVRARDGAGNFGVWSTPSKTVVPHD